MQVVLVSLGTVDSAHQSDGKLHLYGFAPTACAEKSSGGKKTTGNVARLCGVAGMGPSCVYMTGSQGYIYEAGNMLGEVGGASSVVGGAGSVVGGASSIVGGAIRWPLPQDEPEDVRAVLWYKVARNSTDVQEQAKAYQEAITLLKVTLGPCHSGQPNSEAPPPCSLLSTVQ